jgi:hypothetical protein
MGVSIHYWAIPPSSRLFERLQSDRAFVSLMGALFPYGSGVFHCFEELATAEREEILRASIDDHGAFLGSEPDATRLIEAFRLELEQTRLSFPGIEQRRCSLEKISLQVEERLTEVLKQDRGDAAIFAGKLVYGDKVHGAVAGMKDDPLEFLNDPASLCAGYASPALVKEGAEALSGLDAEALFVDEHVWVLQQFQRWRGLYVDAASHGDALCVGVC